MTAGQEHGRGVGGCVERGESSIEHPNRDSQNSDQHMSTAAAVCTADGVHEGAREEGEGRVRTARRLCVMWRSAPSATIAVAMVGGAAPRTGASYSDREKIRRRKTQDGGPFVSTVADEHIQRVRA